MTTIFQRGIFIIAAVAAVGLSGCASMAGREADKVVYHINDSANATALLRNVGNHLDVDPTARIVVVSHAQGVDFLMNDVKDANGNPYNINVEKLVARGVTFDVCEVTLKSRKLNKQQFIPEAKFVPSGVAEIAKLQAREGYAYLKP
ncbi:MAG TPA: DsrE family protein [Gallionellaceae bacterium]|nr:DsrE family protein [Gallionellaceae bacterium]